MKDSDELNLGYVQETLLLPLWGRAIETLKKKPLLIDNTAVSIINNIPYDFTVISKNIDRLIQLGWIARSIYFDKKIKAFSLLLVMAHFSGTVYESFFCTLFSRSITCNYQK